MRHDDQRSADIWATLACATCSSISSNDLGCSGAPDPVATIAQSKGKTGLMHRIDVHNLTETAGLLSLNIPHLRFHQCRTACLIRRSGSGKSLFAEASTGLPLRGLDVRGSISLDGEIQSSPLWKDHIFVLLQEPAVAPDPTMQDGK